MRGDAAGGLRRRLRRRRKRDRGRETDAAVILTSRDRVALWDSFRSPFVERSVPRQPAFTDAADFLLANVHH